MLKQQPTSNQGLRVVLKDPFKAQQVIELLRQNHQFNHYDITSWHKTHGKLFDAVKMEKNMMWLMLSLIIAVAAFNIVSALVMMVTQKQGEIAILKTLGLTNLDVAKVFTLQGALNGIVGACWGLVLGSALCLTINPLMDATGINILGVPGLGLPLDFSLLSASLIGLMAIGLAILASLYPAHRASKLLPADVLRYE